MFWLSYRMRWTGGLNGSAAMPTDRRGTMTAISNAASKLASARTCSPAEPAPSLPLAANDAEPAADTDEAAEAVAESAPRARKARAASSRTRIPRDTTRWNKRAVREALNA